MTTNIEFYKINSIQNDNNIEYTNSLADMIKHDSFSLGIKKNNNDDNIIDSLLVENKRKSSLTFLLNK